MDLVGLMISKPVLIGLHLGFAIVGIDAFLWMLGVMRDEAWKKRTILISAVIGTLGFIVSWVLGGFYYVKFYGSLVKPIIKGGLAPWAHNIIMETKEHIFLFIIPLAVTALFIALLDSEEYKSANIRKQALVLVGWITILGLSIGLMGFIISAAARWGA